MTQCAKPITWKPQRQWGVRAHTLHVLAAARGPHISPPQTQNQNFRVERRKLEYLATTKRKPCRSQRAHSSPSARKLRITNPFLSRNSKGEFKNEERRMLVVYPRIFPPIILEMAAGPCRHLG